jgi:YegS/Rv2252/BmrU family lipid kinase
LKALIIINPLLERRSGKDIPSLIDKYLDRARFRSTVLYSDYPGHAKDLAEEHAGSYDLIIAAGGDGTINEIAQSLIYSETLLGILPIGSGNGLARSLGIPLRIIDAIKTINALNVTSLDSGMAGDHKFFNIAGIGIAAEVAHSFARSKRRGFISYALNLLKTIPGYTSLWLDLSCESRITTGRFFDVSIANSTQWGYGAQISPHSKPDDGFLDICLLQNFPRILVPELLARLYMKSMGRSRYMQVLPVRSAVISGGGTLKAHVDGQPVEFTLPVEISVIPGSIKVIAPVRN